MEFGDLASIIAAIASVSGVVIGIIAYRRTVKEARPQFAVYRTYSGSFGMTSILIQSPSKPIDECRVLYNGTELNTRTVPVLKSVYIHAAGSGIFELPEKVDEDAAITIKDRKQTLKEYKLSQIPYQ